MYKCLPGTLDGRCSHPRHLRATKTRDPRSNEVTTDTKLRSYDDYEFPFIFLFKPSPDGLFFLSSLGSTSDQHQPPRLLQTCMPHTSFLLLPTSASKILSCWGGVDLLRRVLIYFNNYFFLYYIFMDSRGATCFRFFLIFVFSFEIWFGGFGDSILVHRSRVLLRLGGVRSRQR